MAQKSIAKSKRSRPSDAELIEQFEEFRRELAALTEEQAREIDRGSSEYDVHRRLAMFAFVKSGAELIEMANRDRKSALVVAFTAEAAKRAAAGLRELADWLDRAQFRAELALCERPDMCSVLAEAEATYSDDVEVGHA